MSKSADVSNSKRKREIVEKEEEKNVAELSVEPDASEERRVWVVLQTRPVIGVQLIGVYADPEDAARATMKAMYIPLKDGKKLCVPASCLNTLVTPSSKTCGEAQNQKK